MLRLLEFTRFFSSRAFQKKYKAANETQLYKSLQLGETVLFELKQNSKSKATNKALLKLRKYKAHPQVKSLRKRILKEVSKQKKQQKREIEMKVQEFENLINQLIGELQ